MENTFEDAYKILNPAQKKAVDTIEGPVMVVAGPGTGKTQILTLRIANILQKTDVPADAILALTFTEAAATNMRKRLVKMLGARGYYVNISTFHGFANSIIQEFPEYFPQIVGGRSASDVERISIIRDLIDKLELKTLKPFGSPHFYVSAIQSNISKLKREGISTDEFQERIKKQMEDFSDISDLYYESGAHKGKMKGKYQKSLKNIERNKELATIYEHYEETLSKEKLYDFEDMILKVNQAFYENVDLLLEIQERSQYILVDEHQDTNGAQNKLLEHISGFHENPNLFIVGDEKQAIFRFQGANLDNFLYFEKKYPGALLINLSENYRSTQAILDSAKSVITNNTAVLNSSLKSQEKDPGQLIGVFEAQTREDELVFISKTIKDKLDAGVDPSDIAIIYRQNKEAFPIAEFLEKQGVPFIIESKRNLLDDPEIKKLIAIFRAVNSFGDEEALVRALHVDFLDIEPLDLYKLLGAKELGRSVHSIASGKEINKSLNLADPSKLHSVYGLFRDWSRAGSNEHFLSFFGKLIRESGILSHILSSTHSIDRLNVLTAFFESAKKIASAKGDYRLKDFIDHLAILEEHGATLPAGAKPTHNSVRLMTAHGAKGLEFDTVIVPGLTNGNWGNRRSFNYFDLPLSDNSYPDEVERNEDERRLFYVALTRAKRQAFISYPLQLEDGRESAPSQFVSEIRPELTQNIDPEPYHKERAEHPEIFFQASNIPSKDKEFLTELFLSRGFAVTHLNNYLECPWKYFYVNLMRIPQSPSRSQIYGIAVHSALQRFFDAKRSDPKTGPDVLLKSFKERLAKEPLTKEDQKEILEKGKESLSKYYDEYKNSWNYNTVTEFNIKGVSLGPVHLTGKIDKLEIHDNGTDVVVIDYKTGKPKSSNWIEGNTKSSDGSYKRQLVFYKLLMDKAPEHSYKMVSAGIDFVEPNQSGNFKKFIFNITSEEVSELESLTKDVVEQISSLSFWDKRCEDKKCRWCGMREMMGGDRG